MPRPLFVIGGIACVFFITIAIMWALMPYPRKDIDYLVMGGTATMISMAILFVVLIRTSKNQDIFYKRKK